MEKGREAEEEEAKRGASDKKGEKGNWLKKRLATKRKAEEDKTRG